MRILRHVAKSFAMRPLAIAALGLMAGALVDSGAGEPCQWAAVAVVAALLIPAVARCYKRRRVPCVALEVALFAIVLALFAGVGGLRASSSRTEFVMTEEACSLSGTVTMVSRRDSMRTRVVLAADTLAGETFRAAGIGVMVDIPATALPDSSPVSLCGRRLALTGRTCVPYPDPLSDFDYLEYLRSSGVSAMVKAQTVRQLASEGMSVAAMAGAVNEWFTRSLVAAGVSEPNIGFLKALVLADRSTLPPDVRQSFSACGTSHVLAVSGLHVGVLSGAVVWLLSLFAGRRVAAGVSVPVVWLYVLLAGASPSIVRSAVMFSFLSAEVALGRRLPSFHSLWAALCVIVFADPTAASSVSLWLSFAAVGGLLAAMPVFKGWLQERPWPVRAFLSGLIVSVAAQLATLPALLYVFHSVPVYFWLNNLVVVEPIKWVFILSLLCPVALVMPAVGGGVGWCADTLLSLLTHYCRWAASLPMATIDNIPCGVAEFAVLSLAVCAAFYFLRRRAPERLSLLALSLFVAAGVVSYSAGARGGAAVEPFASRGVAGVVVADGRGRALFLVDEADEEAARGVVRKMSARRGWDAWEVDCRSSLCLADVDGVSYAVVSSAAVDSVPMVDVAVVNCDIVLPPSLAREWVFTDNCECRHLYR